MTDGISNLLGDEKVRFHVVDSENRQRSSDWIIWQSNESLYVAVISLSSSLKLSLHPRGTSEDGKDSQFSTASALYRKAKLKGFSGGHSIGGVGQIIKMEKFR